MKCIVIETSPERVSAKPVTNEDGTPHIYATMSEASAELRANGYSYNRANDRYYIRGTEYRAYILRADSEEYAEIMEQAEQNAAPEYIEPEHIQTVSGNKIYRSVDPVTGWNVFTVAGRDFWELAEARHFAQCNPTDDAKRAEIIAELVSDPAAPDDDRATVAAMVEAIAERTHAAEAIEDAREAWTGPDYYRIAYSDGGMDATNEGAVWYETAADLARDLRSAYESATDTHLPYAERIERPTYQRGELEAYLGEYANDYDIDAIEAEATEHDPKTGRTLWTPEAVRDLWTICERHER